MNDGTVMVGTMAEAVELANPPDPCGNVLELAMLDAELPSALTVTVTVSCTVYSLVVTTVLVVFRVPSMVDTCLW